MQQSSEYFLRLERVVSKTRLASYAQNGGNETAVLCRYLWNTALCESLYPSFQILEVGFRNSLHREIAKWTKESNWLSVEFPILKPSEVEAIQEAKEDISLRGKQLTEDILIAELRFGFWTSLLDSRYDRMWPKIIGDVFPNMPRTIRVRGEASKIMNTVRRLRNAASHHHSIWHWHDLEQQHKEMRLLVSYICKSIDEMAAQIDRFPTILRDGPDQFIEVAKSIFSNGKIAGPAKATV